MNCFRAPVASETFVGFGFPTGGGERGLGIPNVVDRVVQQALLQALEPLFIVALSHWGLRFGELVGLRWSDVDFEAGLVRIADERTSVKKLQARTARTTKGRRSRTIPLHFELAKMLRAMPKLAEGRVFHSARGGILRESNALKIFKEQVIRPLAELLLSEINGEIGFSHDTFHSFRHFSAANVLLAGPPKARFANGWGTVISRSWRRIAISVLKTLREG